MMCILAWVGAAAAEDLPRGFADPPDTARPQTWWHWIDGNVSREGILAELEAMKRIGLGGVQMFMAGREAGSSKVACLSPAWHEMVRLALAECDRLGLAFTVQNSAGWSGAGGPWISPDKGMFHVVSSRHAVAGGETLELPSPPSWPREGGTYYRDVAVLAFPTPGVLRSIAPLPSPSITSSFAGVDLTVLNNPPAHIHHRKAISIPDVPKGQTAWVQFEFPAVVTCRAVTITGVEVDRELPPDDHRAIVLASDDGREFREVCRLSTFLYMPNRASASVPHAIPATTAKYFRLAWDGPANLMLANVAWSAEPTIYSFDSKIAESGRTLLAEPVLPTEEGTAVPLEQVVDLTGQRDGEGKLKWTAPAGHWTVLRIGYRNTGRGVAPAPPEGRGLECDKFTRDVVDFHFDQYVGSVLKDAEAISSKAFGSVLIDSYEAEVQNWSPTFADEFRKRRGYDVLRYLPAMAGYIVGDREITDRFLRDVRQTCSDLISDEFYGGMAEQAHKNGLKLYAESCGGNGVGTTVADALQHYLRVDIPMTEAGRPMKPAVSAAHVAGKRVVAMEAFTEGAGARWEDCPSLLKPQCDAFFCAGINRLVFHTYAHNPDVARVYPGPVFWNYGMPLSRGQTWWEMGHAWMTYLARCQFLLQQGNPAADVLYFYGEDPAGPIINVFPGEGKNLDQWTSLPKGYDFDLLPVEVLLNRLAVKDGQLTLPDGTTYRLLVLRDSDRMTPEAAAKIKELVEAGATVLGPRPRRSLSLTGYPQCDDAVRTLGNDVWGDCDGKKVTQRTFGKGRILSGLSLSETLTAIGLTPDFTVTGNQDDADIRFIHRRDGDTEIYFLSNRETRAVEIEASFRVNGKQPELWNAVNGQTYAADSFREEAGRTLVPLKLDRNGSLFVVFRPTSQTVAPVKRPAFRETLTLAGPYRVSFSPGWGAPETAEFSTLEDWSKRSEPGIRYYSGTAVYRTAFDWNGTIPEVAALDLGDVGVIAEVMLNGVNCGVAWTQPYRVDISKGLKTGRNELEIRVANTWANRLIGEGQVPDSTLHTWTNFHAFKPDSPLERSGLLGPITIQTADSKAVNR